MYESIHLPNEAPYALHYAHEASPHAHAAAGSLVALANAYRDPAELPETALQIHNAQPLAAHDRRIHSPAERRDRGAIEYTTTAEAVHHWAADPHGEAKFNFLSQAYGIQRDEMPRFIAEAGLDDYARAKAEGRMVGMVSAQIPKPTYYFMSNAFAMGELSRWGVPTALMVSLYPQDRYHTENSDKLYAFGNVDFPIGMTTQTHKGVETPAVETVQVELRPYGIRHDDGSITRINAPQDANGYRCEQVLVQVVDARAGKQSFVRNSSEEVPGSAARKKVTEVFPEAALGLDIPGLVSRREMVGKQEVTDTVADNVIPITDFYKLLWTETVTNLRRSGDLPSEAEMPMFFVDVKQMYGALAKYAKPPAEVLDMMAVSSAERVLKEVLHVPTEQADAILAGGQQAYDDYLASRGMTQAENGLLMNGGGVMDPGGFYAAQTTWADLYLECSSCGGDYFVDRLARSQAIKRYYGVPETEVRLPDAEIPEMEAYVVHPTGRVFAPEATDPRIAELAQRMAALPKLTKAEVAADPTLQAVTAAASRARNELVRQIAALSEAQKEEYYGRLAAGRPEDFESRAPFVPPIVASTYRELFVDGVAEAFADQRVQSTIGRVRAAINF